MQTTFSGQHYINGAWQGSNGPCLLSSDPVTNTAIWQGSQATNNDVLAAASAAYHAFGSWASLSVQERFVYLKRFAEQVHTRASELAELISIETGKPLWEAMTEVNSVINKIDAAFAAHQERSAEKVITSTEVNQCLRFKPHGVVVVLGAFNFPAHLSNGHIVPALLAGNTILYKPSELTPAVAELIMQCWHDSQIPAGVINCLQGDATVGQYLLNSDIQGVYFTGSYSTGKRIHQYFSGRPEIILALEMGGNNPLIVDDVTNKEAAVYHTLMSTMITAGQRCSCARRLIIKDNAKGDAFLQAFIDACLNIKIGHFTSNPEPFMGSVISSRYALNHLQAQQSLIEAGGQPLLHMHQTQAGSALLSPGIIEMTRVSNPSDEEIFAPLVQVYRYKEFSEALMLANRTRYGLSAGLLSDDPALYQAFLHQIRAGVINWNRPTTGSPSTLPFGGIGCSGNHRPSGYFATDYCAYPVASMETEALSLPDKLVPGVRI